MNVVEFLTQLNRETEILLSLSIILFSGFILTRMTNTLNMPKVSGYILAGILIGPCCFNFIPESMIEGMSFVSDLALAFIAFGVGKFFKKEVLMRTGKRIIVITISEALAAGVLVTVCLKFLFHLNWEFALILGAIATATAPASTMMTINQYKAKGEFVDTLLQIVALDDVVCLLAFSIVSAIINGNAEGGFHAHDLLIPVAYNLLVIVLGIFCGYFLSRLLIPTRSKDNRLILAIAMLLGLSGICAAIDISPLLSCMVFGAVYINLTKDKKLFRQINSFTPPVMSVFFIVSGMNLDLNALKTVGAIGAAYFIIRIIGKYMGTYLSCLLMKTGREIRNYMGFALIPQAGVAIGLAFLGQRMLPPETGNLMLTIILSSSVLYEMVGPVSAKAALVLSGSISLRKEADGAEESEGSETSEVLEISEISKKKCNSEEMCDSDTEDISDVGEEKGSFSEAAACENQEGFPGDIKSGKAGSIEISEGSESAEVTGRSKSAVFIGDTEPNRTAAPAGDAETIRTAVPAGDVEPNRTAVPAGNAEPIRAADCAGNVVSIESAGRPEKSSQGKAKRKAEKIRKMKKEKTPKEQEEHKESKKQKELEDLRGLEDLREPEEVEEPEIEEEEDHAALPELREYNKGVEELDVYDMEKEIKPRKNKKKKANVKAR